MVGRSPRQRGPTAEELVRRLNTDPEFRARREAQEADRKRRSEADQEALAPLLDELRARGFAFATLDELRTSGQEYRAAIGPLLDWLPRLPENVKETAVRTLSVPWARPQAAAPLIKEFCKASDPLLRWAIGNALSVVADDSVAGELCDLVQDKRYGKAREMVTVALGNVRSPRATEVLLEALQDPEVAGHAVMALGLAGDARVIADIEPFLEHSKPWVRREATKAIQRLNRGGRPRGSGNDARS